METMIEEILARVNHGTRRSCVRVPLSRRLLLALPDGCFIASNCFTSTGESKLKAELTDKNREELWDQIKSARLQGRMFAIGLTEVAARANNFDETWPGWTGGTCK
jgi:hypothetical protein